jgi:hypothetical protein
MLDPALLPTAIHAPPLVDVFWEELSIKVLMFVSFHRLISIVTSVMIYVIPWQKVAATWRTGTARTHTYK